MASVGPRRTGLRATDARLLLPISSRRPRIAGGEAKVSAGRWPAQARAAPACACAQGAGGSVGRGLGASEGDSPWGAARPRAWVPAPAGRRAGEGPKTAGQAGAAATRARRSRTLSRRGPITGRRRRRRVGRRRSSGRRAGRRQAGGPAAGGRRSAAPARLDRGTVRRRHWPALPGPAAAHWPPRCTIVTSLASGRSAQKDPRKSWEKLEGARGWGPAREGRGSGNPSRGRRPSAGRPAAGVWAAIAERCSGRVRRRAQASRQHRA